MSRGSPSVRIVTGFIPIEGHPRTPAEYTSLARELFVPLVASGNDVRAFLTDRIEDTWLSRMIEELGEPAPTWSVADNTPKNTLAYHLANHQKFAWLFRASEERPDADVLVWIDYGIGHLGVTPEIVSSFLERIRTDDLAIPGCVDRPEGEIDERWPCWRFCGGLMIVPREAAGALLDAIVTVTQRRLERTRNITWEVNALAEAERLLPSLRWYPANHDRSMFENYR